MSQPVISLRTNFAVFGALMAFLVLTIGIAYVDLGRWNIVAAMAIAAAKAALVLLFFMHVKYSNRVTWVFAGAALVWLSILILLTITDYDSRAWLDVPGK